VDVLYDGVQEEIAVLVCVRILNAVWPYLL
jgi:hypothetical protein